MPTDRKVQKGPQKGAGKRAGMSQGPPRWEGAEETPQRGRGQGRVISRDPIRVRALEGAVSVTFHGDGAGKPPGRRSVP